MLVESTLLAKVSLLLCCCMLIGAFGTYLGRNVRSFGMFILLAVLFIGGTIGVYFAAGVSPGVGVAVLFLWTLVSGLFMGPAIGGYAERLGWQTVCLAYAGSAGVMAGTGAIAMFSGIDFSGMGSYLLIGLFGLIIVGVIGIFWRMSRTINIIYSLFGMAIFAGYFLYDFHRLKVSQNTWEDAVRLTMSIYLDFINFLLYLLQFLEAFSS